MLVIMKKIYGFMLVPILIFINYVPGGSEKRKPTITGSFDREVFALRNYHLHLMNTFILANNCKNEQLFNRQTTIYIIICSPDSMLEVKYLTTMNREFRVLFFHGLNEVSDAVGQVETASSQHLLEFEAYFEKLCFSKQHSFEDKFLLMLPNVEINPELNSYSCEIEKKKSFRYVELKKEQRRFTKKSCLVSSKLFTTKFS